MTVFAIIHTAITTTVAIVVVMATIIVMQAPGQLTTTTGNYTGTGRTGSLTRTTTRGRNTHTAAVVVVVAGRRTAIAILAFTAAVVTELLNWLSYYQMRITNVIDTLQIVVVVVVVAIGELLNCSHIT